MFLIRSGLSFLEVQLLAAGYKSNLIIVWCLLLFH